MDRENACSLHLIPTMNLFEGEKIVTCKEKICTLVVYHTHTLMFKLESKEMWKLGV